MEITIQKFNLALDKRFLEGYRTGYLKGHKDKERGIPLTAMDEYIKKYKKEK